MSTPGWSYPGTWFCGDRRKHAGQSAGLTSTIATAKLHPEYGFLFQGNTVLIGEAEPSA